MYKIERTARANASTCQYFVNFGVYSDRLPPASVSTVIFSEVFRENLLLVFLTVGALHDECCEKCHVSLLVRYETHLKCCVFAMLARWFMRVRRHDRRASWGALRGSLASAVECFGTTALTLLCSWRMAAISSG